MVWSIIVSPVSLFVNSLVTVYDVRSSLSVTQTIFAFISIYNVTEWTFCAKIAIMTAQKWLWVHITYTLRGQHVCKKKNEKRSGPQTVRRKKLESNNKRRCFHLFIQKNLLFIQIHLCDPYIKSFLFYVHKRPTIGQIYEDFHEFLLWIQWRKSCLKFFPRCNKT